MENGGMRSGVDHELGLVAVELAIDKNMVSLDRELETLVTAYLKQFTDSQGFTIADIVEVLPKRN